MKNMLICLGLLLVTILSVIFVFAENNSKESISVIFTHDTHSHVLPTKEHDENGNIIEYGGYARLATAIKKAKSKSQNSIIVDGGDFTAGSLFQTIFSTQAAELRLLGEMGVDVTTQGNHEFDFNIDGFSSMLNSAKNSADILPEFVMSNMDIESNESGGFTQQQIVLKESMKNYGVKEYTVIQKSNINIAVFGLLGEDANKDIVTEGISFKDNIDTARQIVNKIKQESDADMIICLSHSGTSEKVEKSEDEILAKEVPEIDVIVSGHTHTTLTEPIVYGNTYIVGCGAYCRNLGEIDLVQNESGRWDFIDYNLTPIDASVTPDKAISTKIDRFKDLVQSEYLDTYGYTFDEILAYSPYNFTNIQDFAQTISEDSLGNLIADSYRYALSNVGDHADISIIPSGTTRASFVKGDIALSDVFAVNSLGIGLDGTQCYPLVKAYVRGEDLDSICEIDASVSNLMKEARLYISGLAYSYNPNRMFMDKVTSVKLVNSDGSLSDVDDDKLYSVVVGWYSAQMLKSVKTASYGLLNIPILDENGKEIEDSKFTEQVIYKNGKEYKEWQALADYLKSFEKVDSLPTIPEYYSKLHALKTNVDSKNLFELIKNPNKITLTVIIIVLLILCILVLLLFYLIRLLKFLFGKFNSEVNGRWEQT